ncbi:MAG TPA: TadE/TadG family type IV pilus assembly protein [Chloroflexota bacterium]|nr:TadE/TadG family type IV pilus assembly protein [Chloroflexota bacterium]
MVGKREAGQILVLFALVQVALVAMAGFAVDYGALLVERTKLQNAVDAASLAGARALVDGANPGTAAARTAVTSYLSSMGYSAASGATISTTFTATGGTTDTVQVQVSKVAPTYFVRVIGINSTTIAGQATAKADQRMVDVMLSLDLTGSMELSGTDDLGQLRRAVVQFINQVNLVNGNPRGPKVGIARFAGVMCRWNRLRDPSDVFIELGPGPSDYVSPCDDDKSVLSNLTQDSATLIKIADGSGGGSCPAAAVQYACPLISWKYDSVKTTTGPMAAPAGLRYNGNVVQSAPSPHYTGTKLPNAISVVNGGGYYAWSTANGGRNNDLGEGNAHKVLVMITDGFDELWPSQGNPAGSPSAWDTQVVTLANQLKLGPDGVAGTADDVEIYTVGFFCTPYNSQYWCASRLADTASPHPCPSGAMPGTATAIDTLLRDISSSAPGSCDHYFPIKKTEDLPQLFTKIAGAITRGRLTQ